MAQSYRLAITGASGAKTGLVSEAIGRAGAIAAVRKLALDGANDVGIGLGAGNPGSGGVPPGRCRRRIGQGREPG